MSLATIKIPEDTRKLANLLAEKLRSTQQQTFQKALERLALFYEVGIPKDYNPSLDYIREFEEAAAGETVSD